VIRAAWRGTVRFLGSAGLALGLLVFAGVWSAVASMIPQAGASGQQVAAWVAAHPGLEPVVGTLGLHQAFTAPVFIVCVALLTLCTALCAWRRTKVAFARSRALGMAARADRASVVAKHDLEIECDAALDDSHILTIATDALEGLGLRPRHKGELVQSVSPGWSVWGSPVFHWALVAFVVVVLLGSLQTSSGLMGVATGQTVPDAPASYGLLNAGPLRDWSAVHRSFRIDSVDPDLRVGNLDYGPAPRVSVLDGSGHVVKTQLVYPNMPLQIGSLTVHSPAFGLSATLSMVDTTGAEVARTVELIDFSDVATSGTIPVAPIGIWGPSGATELIVYVTVPLDSSGGRYVQALPSAPTVRLTIATPGGQTVLDRVVKPGDEVPLPTGGSLRLVNVGWYARLSIVDDWTVPLFYAVLAVALIGLAIAVFARQQYVVATVVEGPDGQKLALSARLWRNASTTRESIVSALTEALGKADGAGEGRDS
jgi:hypothetical protein